MACADAKNFRYFAYSAPLNSFHHHGVTSTPPSIREVYDQAFSTILATTTEDEMDEGRWSRTLLGIAGVWLLPLVMFLKP